MNVNQQMELTHACPFTALNPIMLAYGEGSEQARELVQPGAGSDDGSISAYLQFAGK